MASKITVESMGELAAVVDTVKNKLQSRNINLPDVAGALVTALSAIAVISRHIQEIENAE